MKVCLLWPSALFVMSLALFAFAVEAGEKIEVVELNWVKLAPSKGAIFLPEVNGIQEVIVSNSCGEATVSYTAKSSKQIVATMILGEWCESPFTSGKNQVIVLNEDDELEEYYRIVEDATGQEIIAVPEYSVLFPLSSKLAETLYFDEYTEENLLRITGTLNSGPYTVVGNELHLAEAVYIADIVKHYGL
ncbi:MAG: hypothetical protein AAF197_02700 [Pseudomonadota bacterium]